MPIVVGLGAFAGAVQGSFYLFGNRIDSFKAEGDEFERKEILRRTTRVPVEQTVEEIGEGRGTCGPITMLPNTWLITSLQAFDLPAMRSADENASRRSTDSRLTRSRQLSRVANKARYYFFPPTRNNGRAGQRCI